MPDHLNLRQRILYDLGEKIVLGHYPPGSVLPRENDLADHFDVSRTVVREAIKGLAARGLLVSRPNVGATVNPRSEWQWIDSDVIAWALVNRQNRADILLQVYESFAVIHPAVIENVAMHATAEDQQAIWKAYRQLEKSRDEIDAWDQAITGITTKGLATNLEMFRTGRRIGLASGPRYRYRVVTSELSG